MLLLRQAVQDGIREARRAVCPAAARQEEGGGEAGREEDSPAQATANQDREGEGGTEGEQARRLPLNHRTLGILLLKAAD